MFDLVLKAQGTAKAPPGSHAILPQAQFEIASVMKGKGRLKAKQITSLIGWKTGKVANLISDMCKLEIVSKDKVPNKTGSTYFYNLAVANFELKGAKHEQAS